MLWQRGQSLQLQNTHITAGGGGFTGSLIMTQLLNIKQELVFFFLPLSQPEISPGKKHNYRQVQDAILKTNPAPRAACLVIKPDSQCPQPWDGHMSSRTRKHDMGNVWLMRKPSPLGNGVEENKPQSLTNVRVLAWHGSCWQNLLSELGRIHEWWIKGFLSFPLVKEGLLLF